MELPPGFRFHPTDEELVTHYLSKKTMDARFQAWPLAEFDLNKCEPWDLSVKMKMDEKEGYFFGLKERRYPTGLRARRTTDAGYWKATGKDKEIRQGEVLVGMKKTLVFYMGRAPRGEKTHWVMHEYSLLGDCHSSIYNLQGTPKSEWVICRVFNKSRGGKQAVDPYASIFETATALDVTCFSGGISMDSYHCHRLGHCHRPLFSCSELNRDELGKEIMVSAASQETGITAAEMNGAAGEISCTAAGEIVTLADKCIWNF